MGDRGRAKKMPSGRTTPVKTAQPISVGRGPKRLSRMEKMGDSAEAAMLLEPKLQTVSFSSWQRLRKVTYKRPFARPRRSRNHSSTKLTQGANRRPLDTPYRNPCVMITCTAFLAISTTYLMYPPTCTNSQSWRTQPRGPRQRPAPRPPTSNAADFVDGSR